MPRRRRRAAKPSPERAVELPDHIWEKIASHLSIKDWARASGTCRNTSTVHLRKIDLPRGTPKEGVLWVTKRMATVEAMRLRADCAEQLVLATAQGILTLKKLQHLLIETPEAADGDVNFVPMLTWLLSRADNLQLLSAILGDISYFPPMMQLKHLALDISSSPDLSVFDSISHAVCLETLMINCRVVVPSPGPNLELENLKSLHRLALKRIIPTKLQVWESCTVYVEGSHVSRMSDKIWSNAAQNITHQRCPHILSDLLGVPASFAGFTSLQDVYLSLKGLGHKGANVSLQDGLANVRRLCIIGEDIFVTVPAEVQWEEVWFGSSNALCITFANVNAFVASCSRFATNYRLLSGTWMPVLCKTLAAQGIDFEVIDRANGSSLLNFGEIDFRSCFCGACLKCVAPFEKAVSDFATCLES